MKDFKDIPYSPELMKKIESCTSAEEIVSLAKENNIEITAAEAEEILSSMNRELTDEELDQVSGGVCWSYENPDCSKDSFAGGPGE